MALFLEFECPYSLGTSWWIYPWILNMNKLHHTIQVLARWMYKYIQNIASVYKTMPLFQDLLFSRCQLMAFCMHIEFQILIPVGNTSTLKLIMQKYCWIIILTWQMMSKCNYRYLIDDSKLFVLLFLIHVNWGMFNPVVICIASITIYLNMIRV